MVQIICMHGHVRHDPSEVRKNVRSEVCKKVRKKVKKVCKLRSHSGQEESETPKTISYLTPGWVIAASNTRTQSPFESCQAILWLASGASNEGPRSEGLGPRAAVSWPWVPACGSLEPSRRGGENAQKTRKNGEEMGEIRPKKCEGRELTKDQLNLIIHAKIAGVPTNTITLYGSLL